MYIYYKYAPDETKIVVLSYVDNFVYWYTSEGIGKWLVDTLGKRFHVKFLGFSHWFMSISISHLKDHSISVYHTRYANSVAAEYRDTATVKKSTNVYKTNFPSDIIFTKDDVSTSYEQVEKLTWKLKIHYRACIGSLIYLLPTIVDLIFAVHKLETFHQILLE